MFDKYRGGLVWDLQQRQAERFLVKRDIRATGPYGRGAAFDADVSSQSSMLDSCFSVLEQTTTLSLPCQRFSRRDLVKIRTSTSSPLTGIITSFCCGVLDVDLCIGKKGDCVPLYVVDRLSQSLDKKNICLSVLKTGLENLRFWALIVKSPTKGNSVVRPVVAILPGEAPASSSSCSAPSGGIRYRPAARRPSRYPSFSKFPWNITVTARPTTTYEQGQNEAGRERTREGW